MKFHFNRFLVFLAFLLIALLAIAVNSHAQEEVIIEEGDVCVGFISGDYNFIGVNVNRPPQLVQLTQQAFDVTVDPITGDVYLALWEEVGYSVVNFDGDSIFVSENAFFGFDSYDGVLLLTDTRYHNGDTQSPTTTTYSYSPESGEPPQALISTYGWPARGPEGAFLHNSHETTYNGTVVEGLRGFYPFAFSPDGTNILSIENLKTLWLYNVSEQTSENITPFEGDSLYLTSAHWHPEGILLSSYDANKNEAILFLFQREFGRLVPLMEPLDTLMWHAQVLPCDYLLEQ